MLDSESEWGFYDGLASRIVVSSCLCIDMEQMLAVFLEMVTVGW